VRPSFIWSDPAQLGGDGRAYPPICALRRCPRGCVTPNGAVRLSGCKAERAATRASRTQVFAPLETVKRSALLHCALAQSASQNAVTRPWHDQIAICDREEARNELGEAERRSRLRSRRSRGDRAKHGGDEDPEETKTGDEDPEEAKTLATTSPSQRQPHPSRSARAIQRIKRMAAVGVLHLLRRFAEAALFAVVDVAGFQERAGREIGPHDGQEDQLGVCRLEE
jgi:hypothetical protein